MYLFWSVRFYFGLSISRLVLFWLCTCAVFMDAQNSLIIATKPNNGWTITKKTQPYPINPLPPTTPWLTDTTSGPINDQWTDKVVLAQISNDQNIPISNIGNQARPIWIAPNLCNYTDFTHKSTTYNFRKTFLLTHCVNVESAIITFTVDNVCRMYLNGRQIKRSGGWVDFDGGMEQCKKVCDYLNPAMVDNPPAKRFNSQGINTIEIADVREYLVPGVNVLAVENLNTGGCEINYAWICINLEIKYTGSNTYTSLLAKENVDCNHDGSFTVHASGGTEPYYYTVNGSVPQANPEFTGLPGGTHLVTVTDATGCTVEMPVVIQNMKVYPQVVAEDFDVLTDCEDTTSFIRLAEKDQGLPLSFSLDQGPFIGDNYFSSISPGAHTIRAVNEFGCISEPYPFEIFYQPGYIHTYKKIELCQGERIKLFDRDYFQSAMVRDTTHDNSRCDTVHTVDLRFFPKAETEMEVEICPGDSVRIAGEYFYDEGIYNRILSTMRGCDSLIRLRLGHRDEKFCVEGSCDFFMPNTFSPNGDGINDIFQPDVWYIRAEEMIIFNRWGGVVFTMKGHQPSWDGTDGLQPVEPGVYVYLIRGVCANGSPFVKKGSVTVVR